ncbi:MAG: transglutaminase family protein [Opitutaceae bacterium]|jgi:transglutaminase-like putative cysteine protease|nr:transglutaminase family protein [Opitutaceae bacterium]
MRFNIHHRTHYRYAGEASESFMEARLRPAETPFQNVHTHRLEIEPVCKVNEYVDYFGNTVHNFSIIRRHGELLIDSFAELETASKTTPAAGSKVTVSEARQIFRSEKLRLYEFLHPSPAIALDAETHAAAKRLFSSRAKIGRAALDLNEWIHDEFKYVSGSTGIDTPIATVMTTRQGVCQDFAQVMIAILRSAEIPARYVVGYIETDSQREAAKSGRKPKKLIGAAESHAWVEVGLPGGEWLPLDPTNNCVAGERHVKMASGRDYLDCTPTKGVFKGTTTQALTVSVKMERQP